MALRLFDFMHRAVPAYRLFLKEHGVNPRRIKTIEDFKTLPVMDKASYLRKYNYIDLFPDRDVSLATTISVTSGSTGEPFYFPRGEEQDKQYEYVAELFLRNQFNIDKKHTLGIIGFGMGIWIGGIFTYKNLNKIAAKGYPLTLVPVGTNIELYLKVLKKFGHLFDQVILMGYPPLVKDIIDEAGDYGINWRDYHIKILTATESFSEAFRDYLAKKSGIKNKYKDIVNIYGTVELGTMAHETALANFIRGIAAKAPFIHQSLFLQKDHEPTLAQYHPSLVYFEEVDGNLIASGFGSSLPLIRYSFPDRGGIAPFETMMSRLAGLGIDVLAEMRKRRMDHTVLRLPFVYVYERADSALVVRGANIYAEHIKSALESGPLKKKITGKFSMVKKENKNLDEYFQLHIELKKGIKGSKTLASQIQRRVVEHLRKINSEYNDQYQSVPRIMTPPITLWPYQDPRYFKTGIKQKWVENKSAPSGGAG